MLSVFLLTTYQLLYFTMPNPPYWNACVCAQSLSPIWLFAAPSRLLCPWDFPSTSTGVGYHFLLQGIFLTQGLNPCLLHLLHLQADCLPLSHLGSPLLEISPPKHKALHIVPLPELKMEKAPEACLCRTTWQHVEQTPLVARPDPWAFTISGPASSTPHFVPGLSWMARTRSDQRSVARWKCQQIRPLHPPPRPPFNNFPSKTNRSWGIDIPAPLPLWMYSKLLRRNPWQG